MSESKKLTKQEVKLVERMKFLEENWDTCNSNCYICRCHCVMSGGCIKKTIDR